MSNARLLAESIRQVESGGNYEAQGKSDEYGAYQIQSNVWADWSARLNKGQPMEPTPENQDRVAIAKFEEWEKKGYTPEQIAATWNSGSPTGWENKRGTNKYGARYDVPAYVDKVMGEFNTRKAKFEQTQPMEGYHPLNPSDMELREALEPLPTDQHQLIRHRMESLGHQMPTLPTDTPKADYGEDESWGYILRETAIDAATFIGAGALVAGSAAAAGVTLPAWATLGVTAGVYAGAREVYERVSGKPEPTITEMITGDMEPGLAKDMTQFAENVAWSLPMGQGIKLIGGVSGKVLKGVDYVNRNTFGKVQEVWEPVADKAINFTVDLMDKIPTPMKFSGGTERRSFVEMMQPAIERVGRTVDPETQAMFRKTEVMKRRITHNLADFDKDLKASGLTFKERIETLRALRNPGRLNMYSVPDKVRDVVANFDKRIIDAGLDPLYEKEFRRAIGKQLRQDMETETDALLTFFDPSLSSFMDGKFTRQGKKAILDVMDEGLASPEMREFAKDLMTLPAKLPREVYKAAREAQMAFLKQDLRSTSGMVVRSGYQKEGYVASKHFLDGSGHKMWVPRDVELQFNDMEYLHRVANAFGGKLMSMWKSGKTILRPAYHGRNMISNAILADNGGFPIYRMDVYHEAIKHMRDGNPTWKKFMHDNGGAGSFVQDELTHLSTIAQGSENTLDMAWKMFRKVTHYPAKLQNAEENFFKYAKYLHSTKERGFSHMDAIIDSNKHLLNYGEASVAAGFLRSSIAGPMPFATWYTKILPLTVETAVKHPLRFGKWIMFGMAMQDYAIDQVGMDDEEWDHIKGKMPEWMRSGARILMPWRDAQDRLQVFNATFLMPGIGDIFELGRLLNVTSAGGLQLHNPFISLAAAWSSQTKSSGAPLYFDWEPAKTKMSKTLSYTLEQLMPAVTPMAGVDWKLWEKVINEEQGAPTTTQAMLSSMGLKMQPIEPQKLAYKKYIMQQIHQREATSQLTRELRNVKNPEERQKIIEEFREVARGIYED